MTQLFVRFREALARYANGVHVLGAPASDDNLRAVEARVGRALPPAYRDFLAQWNGALLFHEAVTLFGAAGALAGLDAIARVGDGDSLALGETEWGALELDRAGRVLAVDGETERRVIVGSSFERWLDATMAREGLLFDREGEFREEAFDDGEIAPHVARKRADAGVKADPGAPAWHHELGAILVEAGKAEAAADALERAVSLDATLGDAWFALAKLRQAAGDEEGALEAYRGAALAERAPEESAFAHAHAARAARAAKLDEEAEKDATRAIELDPAFVAAQKTAATHLIEEHDLGGAIERLELAKAIAPADEEVDKLLRLARARKQLRAVD